MTQAEVAEKIKRLHFVGKYPYSVLAKAAGFSHDTIRKAIDCRMTPRTQTRLEMMFKQLPEEHKTKPLKRKPGVKKRFFIRYMNLRNWIAAIEEETGKNPKFMLKKRYDLSDTKRAGYVCTKLDFMLKWYLLKVFGPELQKKKIFMGDCFSAEKWVDRIEKALPNYRRDLVAKIQKRKGLR